MTLLRTALAAVLIAAGTTALAQSYPAKPIRMVVPYTPRGSIDTVGRIVAEEMQKELGQPIVVDNKPGASGNDRLARGRARGR